MKKSLFLLCLLTLFPAFATVNQPSLSNKGYNLDQLDATVDRVIQHIPPSTTFPTLDKINQWLSVMEKKGFTVKTIGHSSQGRPIKMAIVNPKGKKTALFLAYVHPNEPAGFLCQRLMLETLAEPNNPITEAFANVRFLFVIAMDPDGLVRNQGFYRKRTMLNYLMNYYRGSLQDSAIYNLPYPGQKNSNTIYRTPATKALLAIIETYKPDFINELHGAEYGDMLYWSWQPTAQPALASKIQNLLLRYYPIPAKPLVIQQIQTIAEKKEQGLSPKGGTTLDFARMFKPRMQVFNLELGMWANPMKYDKNPSKITAQQANAFYAKTATSLLTFYKHHWPTIAKIAQKHMANANVRFFYNAFVERTAMANFTNTNADAKDPLTRADVFNIYGSKTILLLRNYALLYGLLQSLQHLGAIPPDYLTATQQLSGIIVNSRVAAKRIVAGDTLVSVTTLVKILTGSALYALATTIK